MHKRNEMNGEINEILEMQHKVKLNNNTKHMRMTQNTIRFCSFLSLYAHMTKCVVNTKKNYSYTHASKQASVKRVFFFFQLTFVLCLLFIYYFAHHLCAD